MKKNTIACLRMIKFILFVIFMIIPYLLQGIGIILEFIVRWVFDFNYLLKSVRNGYREYDGTENYTIMGSADGGQGMYLLGRWFASVFKKVQK